MKKKGLACFVRVLISAVMFLWTLSSFAQSYRIDLAPRKSANAVLENSFDISRFVFSLDGLHVLDVKTDSGEFSELILPGGHFVGETGSPKLPALNRIIEIPYGAEARLIVKDFSFQEYSLQAYGITNPLMPMQPSLLKTQDDTNAPFYYQPRLYEKSEFIEPELAHIEVLGTLRGIRLARLTIAPVAYHPVSGMIRVYNDIEVEVHYQGSDPSGMADIKATTFSPYFDVVSDQLFNSFSDHPGLKSLSGLPGNPVRMILISSPDFRQTLQAFVKWQNEKGFEVIEGYTDQIGASAAEIRSFISNIYHSSTPEKPAPSFVVLAGDISHVPPSAIGSASGEVTDLYYAAMEDDYFPDMYYGRLSARNNQELENQINKIIYYQQYQFEDPSFLNDVSLISGVDSFWNQLILQPTVKYAAQNYFHTANGFANVNLFLSTYEGVYDTEKVSVSMINYTAHCNPTSWSGPTLFTSDVHHMSNTGKYPLVIGNCCKSALFSQPESIGEAWVRAENKGAVAYIGSAPDTHWFEDFYWSVGAFPIVGNNAGYVPSTAETTMGAYDAPFHTDYMVVGAIPIIGNLAITQAHIRGYQTQSNVLWYWQGYHILGDPSTMIYLTEAEENHIEHNPVLPVGQDFFSIKALPGSYAAISRAGELISAGFVGESGLIELPVHLISEPGNVKLVITKSRYVPYIKEIPAMILEGPYVVYDNHLINDQLGNNNNKADYDETFSLHLGLKNIGRESVSQVYARLSTEDPYVSITNSDQPVVFSGMATEPGKNISAVADAFQITISEQAPNQHRAMFMLQVDDGQHEWESGFYIPIYAPVLWIDPEFIINDSYSGNNNSRLDPGESISLGFRIYNQGGSQAKRPQVKFTSSSPYFTHTQNQIALSQINPGDVRVASFSVQANEAAQHGTLVPLDITAFDGHSANILTSITIGQAPEIKIGDKALASYQFPFYNLYKANRTQMIYLARELGPGEKTIKRIGFDFIEYSTRQNTFNNFAIRIKHIDAIQFLSDFYPMHDANLVYYSSSYQMPIYTGLHYWDINDFVYDGRRNLLIEITWGLNSNWTTPFYRLASTELNRNRVAYGISDQSALAPFSGISPVRPNLYLTFQTPQPKPAYSINFYVKNGYGQAVSQANVKIGTKVQQTNILGMTTFSLYPGNYNYRVSTNHPESFVESAFSVVNSTISFMTNFFDVTFRLKNAKSQTEITDARISVNGHQYEAGQYLLQYLPPGQYQFSVTRDDFLELNGDFHLQHHNLEIDLMMEPDTLVSVGFVGQGPSSGLKIFPNPAREFVRIVIPAITKEARVDLMNQQGQVIRQESIDPGNDENTLYFNTATMPPGMYFIRFRQEEMVVTEKLILY